MKFRLVPLSCVTLICLHQIVAWCRIAVRWLPACAPYFFTFHKFWTAIWEVRKYGTPPGSTQQNTLKSQRRGVPPTGFFRDEFVLSGRCLPHDNDYDRGKCFFRPARQLKTPPEAPTSSSSDSEKKAAGHAKLQKQRGPGMLKMDPLLRIG